MCRSVSGLIDYIKARRNVGSASLKVGIDGGKGSLKIILNIEESVGAYPKSGYKDSGVRQTIILALAPGVHENYYNISKIWEKLKLDSLQSIVAGNYLNIIIIIYNT